MTGRGGRLKKAPAVPSWTHSCFLSSPGDPFLPVGASPHFWSSSFPFHQMVIPGDPEEMAEFQAQTMAASQYALEVTLPTAHIFLPSKEFYESIYNR